MRFFFVWIALVAISAQAYGADVVAKMQTSKGDIEIKLFADKAPHTVANFVELARKGFYDNLTFHRIVPGFVIQGGDPKGNGTGGPGYCFADEFAKELRHTKAGTLSMANSGPNTNGSQFFITLAATPRLDDKHAVFGEVTKGLEIVEEIGKIKNLNGKLSETVTIKKVEVDPAYQPGTFPKIREPAPDELDKLVQAKARTLLETMGKTLDYGALQKMTLEMAHAKCGESQIAYLADFATTKGAKLLMYGKVAQNGMDVMQVQFGRPK